VPECPIFGILLKCSTNQNFLERLCTPSFYTTTVIVLKVCNLINHEMSEKHNEREYKAKQDLIKTSKKILR